MKSARTSLTSDVSSTAYLINASTSMQQSDDGETTRDINNDINKMWCIVSEFFRTEATFINAITSYCNETNNPNNDNALHVLNDGLKIYKNIIKNESEDIKAFFQEIVEKFKDLLAKEISITNHDELNIPKGMLNTRFEGNLQNAIDAMLEIIQRRINDNLLYDYIHNCATRNTIATVEDELGNILSPRLNQSLNNTTILATQRYPRYLSLLSDVNKTLERCAKNGLFTESSKKASELKANVEDFLANANLIADSSLIKIHQYFDHYADKNSKNYSKRKYHFESILNTLRLDQPINTNVLNNEIEKFARLSISTHYADLLRELVAEIENEKTFKMRSHYYLNYYKTAPTIVKKESPRNRTNTSRLSLLFIKKPLARSAPTTTSSEIAISDFIMIQQPYNDF